MRNHTLAPVPVDDLEVTAFRIPTDAKESDGTLEWDSTTMVLVRLMAGNHEGLGYTYADVSSAHLISSVLRDKVIGQDSLKNRKITDELHRSIRNNGNSGIAFMALSAVDIALWDLKAKLLNLPLAVLLGQVKEEIMIYGSGGFTSYTDKQLTAQMNSWTEQGIQQVKMKIGRNPGNDPHRIKICREAIGNDCALFVDANGAYSAKQAIRAARSFEKYDIAWYEEPVSSDDLNGLAQVRQYGPQGMQVAAGEYGYDLPYFKHMLSAGAVDVLQADATRCGGITGFLNAGTLAKAFNIPFSFHCAPSVHLHAALAMENFYTGEYFHDHERIEHLFFDGFRKPVNGRLSIDTQRPGLGLELKKQDAEKYKILEIK